MASYGANREPRTANRTHHFLSGCLIVGFGLMGVGFTTLASEMLTVRGHVPAVSVCLLEQSEARSVRGGGVITEARPQCDEKKVRTVLQCQTGALVAECEDGGAGCSAYTCRTDCSVVYNGDELGGTQSSIGSLTGSLPCGTGGLLYTYDLLKCTWWFGCDCSGAVVTTNLSCPRTYSWWVSCAGP